jgi:hypothetical protein
VIVKGYPAGHVPPWVGQTTTILNTTTTGHGKSRAGWYLERENRLGHLYG